MATDRLYRAPVWHEILSMFARNSSVDNNLDAFKILDWAIWTLINEVINEAKEEEKSQKVIDSNMK